MADKKKAYDSQYVGVDGWDSSKPVSEISDAYVRGQFVEQARIMLGTLERMTLVIGKEPLDDSSEKKKRDGQCIRVVKKSNPQWYSQLYSDPRYTRQRKGRIRMTRDQYGKRVGEKGRPGMVNKGHRKFTSTTSIIRRDRIVPALERIIDLRDERFGASTTEVPRRVENPKVLSNKRAKRFKWARARVPYRTGHSVKILRELIAERLINGYLVEKEGDESRNSGVPDNRVRAYFGEDELSEDEIMEFQYLLWKQSENQRDH